MVIKSDASRLLQEISRFLAAKGIRAYVVGGFIRDMLLERATADIDIAVAADALEVAAQTAAAFNGKFITLDDIYKIGRVILPGEKWQIDFTAFEGDILEDLARRDFTIDAMALELDKNIPAGFNIKNIIDPFNGQADLRRRVIKAVSDDIFREDAVRLLRAVRLAAELNFNIDKHTETLISRDSPHIDAVAGERIREELMRLLAAPGAGPRLFYLDKLDLLDRFDAGAIPS